MDKHMEIQIDSIQLLERMYGTIDEMGLTHDYSLTNGELNVKFGEQWVLFYVDKKVMEDEALLDEAFDDAQRVAEGYWNQ